uniref:Uncharacterized protein n=1 Tax=Trichogramma kaykai TaxID=54128 RepID=A0ABD2X9U2_9HYME
MRILLKECCMLPITVRTRERSRYTSNDPSTSSIINTIGAATRVWQPYVFRKSGSRNIVSRVRGHRMRVKK